MLVKVPTVKTNFSKSDFVEALIKAWKEDYGCLPSKKQISIVFAQWSIETGQGNSCWNFNIGNSKVFDIKGKTVEYIALNGVWEIINGKRVVLDPSNPGAWFMAFRTLDEGVRHHFNLLKNKRYQSAWSAIEAESPAQFAHLLKINGYYTASEEDYTKAVVAYSNSFMKSSLFEEALNKIGENKEPFSSEKIEYITPLDLPTITVMPEINRELPQIIEDSPLKLNWFQQIFSFIFEILRIFLKKN